MIGTKVTPLDDDSPTPLVGVVVKVEPNDVEVVYVDWAPYDTGPPQPKREALDELRPR